VSNLRIPPGLARNVLAVWGEGGRRFLDGLPAAVSAAASRWGLDVGEPYPLSYHWVAPVVRGDGTRAVLKLGPPGSGHLGVQAAALTAFAGRGAVRLLDHDPHAGALLLERATPGTPLAALLPADDGRATAALVEVIGRLHRPVPPGCPLPDLAAEAGSFAAHLARFPGDDPLPRHLVVRAAGLFAELCASAPGRVVLHGDLHHDNVLAAGREPWLAIDPHGMVGDPGFEASPMLYNPDPARRDPGLLALVPARVEQLADGLGMPVERIRAWGFVMAVLSEVWTVADGHGPHGRPLDVAMLLAPHLT
jgi:streptomycin 6-kinase